jgi:hypothetical protein
MSLHLRQEWGRRSGVRKTGSTQGFLQDVSQMMSAREGWKFNSVEALVLHYGRSYTPAPLPEGICRGEMRQCYSNAMQLVKTRSDLTYVEGYAFSVVFPMGHGWATADGRTAIDPTWDNGSDYFGIPFTRSFWEGFVASTGYWGILFPELPTRGLIDLLKNGLPPGAVA